MSETTDHAASSSQASPDRVRVLGIAFDPLTERQTVETMFDRMEAGEGGLVVTSNLDHLRRSHREERYRRLVSGAQLNVADGMPIVWASRLRGRPLPERVTGADLVHGLVEEAATRGRSVFLLGGNPGVAEQASGVWTDQHPSLRIAGTHCPPLGFESDEGEMESMRAMLRSSEPDLVLVALGSPKQEYLIESLRDELPKAWWIGVGISFSFVAGDVRRAPRWMQRVGLEWLFRLGCEPRRLAKRYLVQGLPFASFLLISAIGARLGGISLYDRAREG